MKKPVIIVVISFTLLFIVITSLFTFRKVELFNNKFSYYASSIDLSNYPIEDFSLWENKLSDFNHLKEVIVNNKSISYEKKLELENKYPDIIFNIKSLIYMNGLSFDSESEEINLSTTVVDDSIKDYLPKFKNLKKVIISNKMDTDKQIELEQEFNNIEFIWPVKIVDKLISSDVETLDLSYAQIKNINEFDKSLSLLHKLKNLDLSYSNLSYKQMGDMRERFPNIEIDWVIKMGVWEFRTDIVSFSVLISNFHYVRLKSSDVEVLKYCTKLEALDLGHQAISDLNVIVDNLPNLKVLILADNKITDISPLAKLKHLHYLELFMNKVTDISPLKENKELVDLNLSNLRRLSDITPLLENDFPLLERLWITRCKISDSDYKLLKEKYTDVKVVTTGLGSTGSGWREHERYTEMIKMFNKRTYISESFTKYDNLVK